MCYALCKQKNVRLKGGRIILIRRPTMRDLGALTKYINGLVEEDAPIDMTERISTSFERKWLKENVDDFKNGKRHYVMALLDGGMVGATNITVGKGRHSHVAEYGISVDKKYRRIGIGSALTKYILDVGKRDKKIKIITLRVYEFNTKAKAMYEKFGFRKVAYLRDRVMYKGKLYGEYVMDWERK
jgi:RimJ/RimL family protein N-acetyltransferase